MVTCRPSLQTCSSGAEVPQGAHRPTPVPQGAADSVRRRNHECVGAAPQVTGFPVHRGLGVGVVYRADGGIRVLEAPEEEVRRGPWGSSIDLDPSTPHQGVIGSRAAVRCCLCGGGPEGLFLHPRGMGVGLCCVMCRRCRILMLVTAENPTTLNPETASFSLHTRTWCVWCHPCCPSRGFLWRLLTGHPANRHTAWTCTASWTASICPSRRVPRGQERAVPGEHTSRDNLWPHTSSPRRPRIIT